MSPAYSRTTTLRQVKPHRRQKLQRKKKQEEGLLLEVRQSKARQAKRSKLRPLALAAAGLSVQQLSRLHQRLGLLFVPAKRHGGIEDCTARVALDAALQ
jgi:hypothetical protein